MLSRRGSASPSQDVIFEAGEDLYSNATLVFTKSATKRIPLTRPRTAQSYCHEFCGIVGVPFSALRFQLDSRPINPETFIISPCIIKAFHSCDILQSSQNSLQPALLDLLSSGLNSDIEIITPHETFRVHKCILMCRSPKFKAMLTSGMLEGESARLELHDVDSSLIDKLLKWIYTGSVIMPNEVEKVCELLLLADEYFLPDLKVRCEEDLISKLNPENVVQIMVAAKRLPIIGDQLHRECKELFVKEYRRVNDAQPNLEEMISSVPGLMTELFSYFYRASSKAKRRRVTFRINENVVEPMDDVSILNSGYSSTASSYT